MRLGQLSRKIGISTSEIIHFLAANNITINDDSNTKIEDGHANLITQKYAPHLLESVVTTIADEKVREVQQLDRAHQEWLRSSTWEDVSEKLNEIGLPLGTPGHAQMRALWNDFHKELQKKRKS